MLMNQMRVKPFVVAKAMSYMTLHFALVALLTKYAIMENASKKFYGVMVQLIALTDLMRILIKNVV